MEISILDLCLVNFVSYIFGLGSGLVLFLKNKDKLLIKSRSNDNLSLQQTNHNLAYSNPVLAVEPLTPSAPVAPSAPTSDKLPIKITLE